MIIFILSDIISKNLIENFNEKWSGVGLNSVKTWKTARIGVKFNVR